jgi:hypothetical protein
MKGLRAHGVEAGGGGIRRRAAAVCALALASIAAEASTSSASFGVSVTLFPNFKDVAACGETTSGAHVSVSCTTNPPSSTPASTPSGAQPGRFMLELYRDGAKVGTVDGETAPGSVASWKVYHVADRDFLEIVVGW